MLQFVDSSLLTTSLKQNKLITPQKTKKQNLPKTSPFRKLNFPIEEKHSYFPSTIKILQQRKLNHNYSQIRLKQITPSKQQAKKNKQNTFFIRKANNFQYRIRKSNSKNNLLTTRLPESSREYRLQNTIDKQSYVFRQQTVGKIDKSILKNKKEIYYCDQLLKEMKKINFQDQSIEGNKIPMVIQHFFQSVSTLNRYSAIQKPKQPFLKMFLSKQRKLGCKITLIFDMDETIIHAEPYNSSVHSRNNQWGQNIEITLEDESKVKINLKIRPCAIQVLQRLRKNYEIGLFTAANQKYAKQIIYKIDPSGRIFDFCLFRQHCHVIDNKLAIKDLRILSNRSIKNMILVDNSPHTYLYQLQNAVPIVSFYEDREDKWMLKLEQFLILNQMDKKDDVRQFLKDTFNFHRYCKFGDIEEMVETLYVNRKN